MRKLFVILMLLCVVAAPARKLTGTRTVPQQTAREQVAVPTVTYDTIVPAPSDVVLSGYDKTLRASSETVFVSNNLEREIMEMVFTTAYYDMAGNEIHRSTLRRAINVPQGATRRLNYGTWDKQASFYFYKSVPARAKGTPYMVRQRVDTVFVLRAL